MAVNDYDRDAAQAAAQEINALGSPALALEGDVADFDQVRAMIQAAESKLGRVHVLVNNAGIGGTSCLVQEMPPSGWERTVVVNLTGVFNCCRAVAPGMIKAGEGGRIVNIASLAARRMSKLGGADYTAAKWGVIGFSKHLAFELAAHHINVNAVCPGATLTPPCGIQDQPRIQGGDSGPGAPGSLAQSP